MDDLFQKYKEVLKKNEDLMIENQKLTTQNILLAEELNMIKSQTNDTQALLQKLENQEKSFKNHLVQLKKYTLGLLGYEIEIKENSVELLSLYAFDRSDKVVFQISGNKVNLLSNEFIDGYKELVELYIEKGSSIPAFLSNITTDLVNKKTFQ